MGEDLYAIKRVEAAQQDTCKSEKRTSSAAANSGKQAETNKKIEKRLTNPERTPTDEEIQWLWNKGYYFLRQAERERDPMAMEQSLVRLF